MQATSSSSEPAPRVLDIAVLKSWDFGAFRSNYGDGRGLPYRMDYLEEEGFRLRWTDSVHSTGWAGSRAGRLVGRLEAATVPFAQTLVMARAISSSPITLAMFESEANFLALARRAAPGRRSSVLVVFSCWLAHVLSGAGPWRRAGYRSAYQAVDRLYYFSENQGQVLTEMLGLDAERLRHVSFGIDAEAFKPAGEDDAGYVLVVGRDKGRDWLSLFEALDGLRLPVKVCCRPADLQGLRVPSGVEVLGFVERCRYLDLLGRAQVVVVATKPLLYPSGQSVLLEAMAMERAVVVTATPALSEYIDDGVTALAVPPGDPRALRERVLEAAADEDLRRRIGQGGRKAVESRFNARAMWGEVGRDLRRLAESRQ